MVRHVSDRVGVVYLGSIVEEASCDDLDENPLHPYTLALLSAVAVPAPIVEDSREPIVLSGDLPSPANPPPGCRFHTRRPWRQDSGCATERPVLRVPNIPGIARDRTVACHVAEEIAAGRIIFRGADAAANSY